MRRRRRSERPTTGGYGLAWAVPPRFNFTRDVVEALGTDPQRRALTFVDREGIVERRTFAEMSQDAARWAHLLRSRTQHGDRVMVMLGKVPAWHGALLGALKGGLVTVPCSDMLRGRDLAFRARHSGARLVVADRSCETEVTAMLGELETPPEVVYLDAAIDELRRHATTAPTVDTASGDPAFILYTSGTTKDPKGVTHSHAYTWAKRAQAERWLDARPGDLVWCTAGTGWAKSIWNVLLGPWSMGAEVVVHEGGFDPHERMELIGQLGVTILCQAPTEYRLLAKSDALELATTPRLRHAVSAGEPLNPEVIDRVREALGIVVHDGYGQTENTLLVANLRGAEVRPGSMGLPTPGHDVAVIDEDGNVCPPGVEGDIALLGRPPSLFLGYWDAPEETAAVYRDGWYVTGDRATCDDDGYLWFTGRADDVILSAAYRIGPFEVESALLEHAAVAESAVVGKPDSDRGEIVKAFVVLRPGFDPSDALVSELQEHAKSVTAPYKYPREIEFVPQLPKTASGKIRRAALRDHERALAGAPPRAAAIAIREASDPAARARREAEEETRRRAERMRAEEERRRAEAAERAAEVERAARARADDYARREAAERAAEDERQRREAAERAAEEERARRELAARAEEERLEAERLEAEHVRRAEEARERREAQVRDEEAQREERERAEEARRQAQALETRALAERRAAEAAVEHERRRLEGDAPEAPEAPVEPAVAPEDVGRRQSRLTRAAERRRAAAAERQEEKRREREAKERTRAEAEEQRRREAQAREDAKRHEEAERERIRAEAEEQRRREAEEREEARRRERDARTSGWRPVGRQKPKPDGDEDKDTPDDPIPDFVERLRRYAGGESETTTADDREPGS